MADWDHFLHRESQLPDRYYSQRHVEKVRAFSFMNAACIEQVKFVQHQLVTALKEGLTFEDFKEAVKQGEYSLELPDYRILNIFRTNVLSAYQRGRYMEHALEEEDYPYYMYQTADDDRVRKNHEALHELIFKFGSAEGDKYYPPNGFQCRCFAQALTEKQAEKRKTKNESETLEILAANSPDPGWAGTPLNGTSAADSEVTANLDKYGLQTIPDAEYKAMLERAMNNPEDIENLKTIERVIPEGVYKTAVKNVKEFQDAVIAVEQVELAKIKAEGAEPAIVEPPKPSWKPGDPIDVTKMTKEQWEGLTDEERRKVHEDNILLAEPLKDYIEERRRKQAIETRSKDLGLDGSEEALSREAIETEFLATRSDDDQEDTYKNLEVLERRIEFIIDIIDKRKKMNLEKYKNDVRMIESLIAISYLTIGEQFLIFDPMSTYKNCSIINKKIREVKGEVEKLDPAMQRLIEIRTMSKKSLTSLGFSPKKTLFRGVNQSKHVKDLNNPKKRSMHNIMLELEKTKKHPTIEFCGGNYPWTLEIEKSR